MSSSIVCLFPITNYTNLIIRHMKHVVFFNELHNVKEIDCESVDITKNCITFYNILSKKNPKQKFTCEHRGSIHYEMNASERNCFVDFGNDKTAVITW